MHRLDVKVRGDAVKATKGKSLQPQHILFQLGSESNYILKDIPIINKINTVVNFCRRGVHSNSFNFGVYIIILNEDTSKFKQLAVKIAENMKM